MHSSEMKVSSLWLKEFGKKIQNLLNEFENVPEVAAAGTKIEKVKETLLICSLFLETWDW